MTKILIFDKNLDKSKVTKDNVRFSLRGDTFQFAIGSFEQGEPKGVNYLFGGEYHDISEQYLNKAENLRNTLMNKEVSGIKKDPDFIGEEHIVCFFEDEPFDEFGNLIPERILEEFNGNAMQLSVGSRNDDGVLISENIFFGQYIYLVIQHAELGANIMNTFRMKAAEVEKVN